MPYVPQDVLDRLAALERQVRQLAGRANIRPAMNQILNGDVRIGEGGQLFVAAPGGVQHLLVGHLSTGYGEREYGVVVRRRDGSLALSIWNGEDPDQPQVFRVKDAQGHDLLTEDVEKGGLYRPWLPLPELANDDVTKWPNTSSTSYTVVEQGNAYTQHPRIEALISAAGNGTVRLLIDDQAVATVTNNTIDTTVSVPNYEFGKRVNIKVEARAATAGTPIYVKTRYLYGVGSAG
ncbi:hypothetical protein ACFCXS_15240 [Streptomyces sp. NPDC056373]|uniref:hypothetical protein n=1 Tax=Streptomyces sp. NPDC056373 TaxID=3345798 RepID=UPI0035D5957E